MLNESLDQLIDYLPFGVLSNKVFQSLIEIMKANIPQNLTIKDANIRVCVELYNTIKLFMPELLDFVEINENPDTLLSLTIVTKPNFISMYIRMISQEEYEIKLLLSDNQNKKQELYLNISDKTMVSLITTTEKDYVTEDYEHDLYYYDHYGYKSISGIDIEAEKDIYFSKRFGVPMEKAREYRINFKQNKDEINRLNEESNPLTFIFYPPLKLANLEQFLAEETDKEIALALEKEYQSEKYSKTGKMDRFIKALEKLIGPSEEIILSEEIYLALSMYFLDVTSKIMYTKGNLIKKENGIYTLYKIYIDSQSIKGSKKELKEDEIKLILEINSNNSELESLNGFFGFGRIFK